MSAKKFNTPFGTLGDRAEIPLTAQIDGSVSYEQGYPFGYDLDYTDPNAKDISRSKMNQLFYDITNAIREIQQGGVSEWSEEGKPYKINSLVYAPDGTIKQSLIANNNNDTTHSSWSNLVSISTLGNTVVKLTGDQTIDGIKTFSSTIVGNITGNSGTATKLQTARNIALTGGVTGNGNFDGTGNLSIATTIAGNAPTATKLATARTINGVAFDGSADITVVDSTKAPLNSPALTGTPTAPTAAVATNNTQIATTAYVKSVVASSGSFTQSLSENGWTKLPNGLIIQWSNYHQAKDTRVTKNFPIAFPSACFVVSITLTNSTNFALDNYGATAAGNIVSASQYTSHLGHYGGHSLAGEVLSMIAIGY